MHDVHMAKVSKEFNDAASSTFGNTIGG
jgi:hypothetical protein